MSSLFLTAKVAGWDWVPMADQPLLWLFTLPMRLLPTNCVALGLNFFSATLAALTLGLLARSVELLPRSKGVKKANRQVKLVALDAEAVWSKRAEKTNRQISTLPIFIACAVCGLEFNFWREATAATGEMLDLLLLAAALWLLLEYRVKRYPRLLDAATFVLGLGMAENWFMLLSVPLFVAGVIWLRGIQFFQLRFLLRLAGLGLAGFSICVLLPLVNGLAPHSPWNFGEAWLVSFRHTKDLIVLLYHQFWAWHRLMAVEVVLFYLVPTLSLLVRVRDHGTYGLKLAETFQLWIYRGLQVLLLLGCLWLAFDPTMGLRQIIRRQTGIPLPLLTLDYLNALGAAFLAGIFLRLSKSRIKSRGHSRGGMRSLRKAVAAVAAACLVLLIAGLVARNVPAILGINHHPLNRFGELAVESLPGDGGVMLSDQPQKLGAFQAALAQHRRTSKWLAVDTQALPKVSYRAWLQRRRPLGWLTDENRHPLTPDETVRLIESIAQTNQLFYLHSSFGRFFERFYLEPSGAIYKVVMRDANSPEIPSLPSATIETNEAFWTRKWKTEMAPLVPAPVRPPNGLERRIQNLGITAPPEYQDRMLAEWYSLSLDSWGVALQQQGHWNAARQHFEQALLLNTNNLSARISLSCNTNLQSGRKLGLVGVEQLAPEWGSIQRMGWVLNDYGPFDEPIFCYLLGCAYLQNGLPRQAVQQLERTQALAPGLPGPELALAEVYTQLRMIDRARPLINHLRDTTKNYLTNSAVDLEVALLEANSWLLQTNIANARNALQSVLLQHPDDARIANRVLNTYLAIGDFTNALQLVKAQSSKAPDDVASLTRQAAILIQSGNAAAAIPVLTHVLTITNSAEVRISRATAELISQKLTAAENDFLELEKSGVEPSRVSYGLAMIAEHRHDTNQALHYLRVCLTNTPSGTIFWRQASARLQSLEHGSPALPKIN